MNTDQILDFIVEYYIWFIIGGAIILVALIGFFADKKNALPNKKGNKRNPKMEEMDDLEEVNESKPETSRETMTINGQDIDKLNEEIEHDKKIEDEPQTIQNIQNDDENSVMEPTNIDENIDDEQNDNINSDEQDSSYEQDTTSDVYSNLRVENQNIENENIATDEIRENNVENNREQEYQLDNENIRAIASDISKINRMEFSEENNDTVEEPVDEKAKEYENIEKKDVITEKKLNDNLEDTMQISYSQLKEMVEDIIAENQKENSVDNNDDIEQETKNSQSIPNEHNLENNDIVDMPLPDLENITVDSINKQDEDEDDVWKF